MPWIIYLWHPLTMRLLMLHLSYRDPWLDATRHLACCSCHCRAKSLIEQLAHERRAPISWTSLDSAKAGDGKLPWNHRMLLKSIHSFHETQSSTLLQNQSFANHHSSVIHHAIFLPRSCAPKWEAAANPWTSAMEPKSLRAAALATRMCPIKRNQALATSKSPASMPLSCSLEFCGR